MSIGSLVTLGSILWFICSDIFSCSQQPELLKLNEEMSRINSKIKSSRKELERKMVERRKHADEIKELESGIQDLSSKMDGLREKSRDVGGKLPLADGQLQEYFQM